MRFIFDLIIVIMLAIGLGFALIFSGLINIAASKPESGVAKWVLEKTKENSVRHHAKSITPPALRDSALIAKGFKEYDGLCVGCHGAPGVARFPVSHGLNPQPPSLGATVDEWKSEELFWIIKNGIKMTGMPAYGGNHSDDELWSIVAFLRTLPDLTPAEYLAMEEKTRPAMKSDTTRKPETEKKRGA